MIKPFKETLMYSTLEIIAPEYFECPYSILKDFVNWFLWHKRVHANGEDALSVTLSMGLADRMIADLEAQILKDWAKMETEPPFGFRVYQDYLTPIIRSTCGILHTSCF